MRCITCGHSAAVRAMLISSDLGPTRGPFHDLPVKNQNCRDEENGHTCACKHTTTHTHTHTHTTTHTTTQKPTQTHKHIYAIGLGCVCTGGSPECTGCDTSFFCLNQQLLLALEQQTSQEAGQGGVPAVREQAVASACTDVDSHTAPATTVGADAECDHKSSSGPSDEVIQILFLCIAYFL